MYPMKMELFKRAHSAIIQDNYKLIKFYDNNEIQLFDLEKDIFEKNDLPKKDLKSQKDFEASLMDYLSAVKAPKWKTESHGSKKH